MTATQQEEDDLAFKREMLGTTEISGLPDKERIARFLQGQPPGSCPMYCMLCNALGSIHPDSLASLKVEGFPVDPRILTVQFQGCPACTNEFGGRVTFREVAKL